MIATTEIPAELTVTGGYDARADVGRKLHCCHRAEWPLAAGGPLDAPDLLPAGGLIYGPFGDHVAVVARG